LFDTTLFNVSIPDVSTNKGKALVLSGCRVVLSEEGVPYSEFDELNYYSLNCNDFGCGRTDIELSFENIFQNPYFKFYVKCVAIRTESEVLCKINRNPALEYDSYTKVTKEGKFAWGLRYYFRTKKEHQLIINCKSFCVEGFVAIKKETNVYGFMCQIRKTDNGWQMSEGNTYRIYKHANIKNLYH